MKRRDEVLVGLLTLVAIAALVSGMLWLARGGLARGYVLYAKFEWGAGLRQGQPVLFSGVNIGYVDDVDLRENGELVVLMRVYKHRRVPLGTSASIAPNGFFGDQLIALHADSVQTGRFYAAGDTITSWRRTPQLSDIVARVDTIAHQLSSLLTTFNTEIGENQTFARARTTLSSADSMFRAISRVADEQSRELTRTQESLRRLASAADSARVSAAIDSIASATANVSSLLADFRQTNEKLSSILAKIDGGTGSAGALVNDPRLERDVRSLLTRMDSLLADVMANPRKYVRLSIF